MNLTGSARKVRESKETIFVKARKQTHDLAKTQL